MENVINAAAAAFLSFNARCISQPSYIHTILFAFHYSVAFTSFEVSTHFALALSSDCHLHLTLTTSEQIYFPCPFRSIPLWHLMVIPWWVVHTTASVFRVFFAQQQNDIDDNDDAKRRYMTITINGMCTMNKHTHTLHISWNLSRSIVQIVELSSILSVAIILIISWNYIWHRFELATEGEWERKIKSDSEMVFGHFGSFRLMEFERTKNYNR